MKKTVENEKKNKGTEGKKNAEQINEKEKYEKLEMNWKRLKGEREKEKRRADGRTGEQGISEKEVTEETKLLCSYHCLSSFNL